MFPPIFPIYIPALAPLHPYAPLVWLAGVAGLWLTRYTHQLGKRWGAGYYVLSALIRPLGVALLAAGWLALYAPVPAGLGGHMLFGRPVGWLPRGTWQDWLWWAAVMLSFALDVWAILALGLRRSFLFRRVEDRLLTSGPYALVRHPQFLSTIAVTFCGLQLFDPMAYPTTGGLVFYYTLMANWVLLALALWLLSILEERELVAHFGAEYEVYARRVPRLVPTLRPLWVGAVTRLREAWAKSEPGRAAARLEARYARVVAALARLAQLALLAVACGTVVVAGLQVMAYEGGVAGLFKYNRWADILCWLGIGGFLGFGAWALARDPQRWLPWGKPADGVVTGGPYALVRQPVLLAAVGVTLLATRPFDPIPRQVSILGQYYAFGSHWLPYTVLVWLVAVLADWGLAARFGAAYEDYARRVPRLFPN